MALNSSNVSATRLPVLRQSQVHLSATLASHHLKCKMQNKKDLAEKNLVLFTKTQRETAGTLPWMSEVDKDKEKLGIRVEYVREKCIVVVKGSANFWLGQEGTKKNGADGGALPDSEDSETGPCLVMKALEPCDLLRCAPRL